MGYVNGHPLSTEVGHSLEPRRAAELVLEITEAVQYAHSSCASPHDRHAAHVLRWNRVARVRGGRIRIQYGQYVYERVSGDEMQPWVQWQRRLGWMGRHGSEPFGSRVVNESKNGLAFAAYRTNGLRMPTLNPKFLLHFHDRVDMVIDPLVFKVCHPGSRGERLVEHRAGVSGAVPQLRADGPDGLAVPRPPTNRRHRTRWRRARVQTDRWGSSPVSRTGRWSTGASPLRGGGDKFLAVWIAEWRVGEGTIDRTVNGATSAWNRVVHSTTARQGVCDARYRNAGEPACVSGGVRRSLRTR